MTLPEQDPPGPRRAPEPDPYAEVTLLSIVRFVSEIALWGGVARVVILALADQPAIVRYLAATLAVVAVVLAWSRWLAPKGAARVVGTPRLVIELVLMTVVAALLVAVGQVVWAAVLVVTFSLGQLAAVRRERAERAAGLLSR